MFTDTPFVADRWTNSCPGKEGPLQALSFLDSFETWLAALHRPSGCYTVLSHFTWSQIAQSTAVDPINMTMTSTGLTSATAVDSGPGGSPVLEAPVFNDTISSQCLP